MHLGQRWNHGHRSNEILDRRQHRRGKRSLHHKRPFSSRPEGEQATLAWPKLDVGCGEMKEKR